MKKDVILIFAIILVVVLLCTGVKIQSVEEHDRLTERVLTFDESGNPDNFVKFSINCSTILSNMESVKEEYKKYVPKNGIIVDGEKNEKVKDKKYLVVQLKKGETVFSLLQYVTRLYNIQMEYKWTGQFGSNYVQGIGHLYEFDCGELSGWMYSVNGKYAQYGCSKCKLKSGDAVEWAYTCDLGRDLGADLNG